jgi:hypothetical protein
MMSDGLSGELVRWHSLGCINCLMLNDCLLCCCVS